MPGIFDTSQGLLVLPNGVTLESGMSLSEVTGTGISFVRATPDRTGFVWRSIEPFIVGTRRIYFALGFDHDRLTKTEFGFTSPPDEMPAPEKRREHDKFLAAELGPPKHTDMAKTIYEYPWGRISSYYDPRTDNAMIILSWAQLSNP